MRLNPPSHILFRYAEERGEIFYLPQWKKVIENSFRLKPFYVVDSNLFLPGFLIKRRIESLPLLLPGNPMMEKDTANILIEYIKNKRLSLLIKSTFPLPLEKYQFPVFLYNSVVELPDDEEDVRHLYTRKVWKTIKNARNRARREGWSLMECYDERELKEWYYILYRFFRRKKFIPPPLLYFLNIFRFMILKGYGMLILLKKKNYIGGGILTLYFKDKAWVYEIAWDESVSRLPAYYILLHTTFKTLIIKKIPHCSLGFSFSNQENVLRIKKRFGASIKPVYVYGIGTSPKLLSIPKILGPIPPLLGNLLFYIGVRVL